MKEETIQILEKLADKLGTTAEHLWGVLVKQAPISCGTSIVMFIISGLFIAALLPFVSKLEKKAGPYEDLSDRTCAFLVWVLFVAIWTFVLSDKAGIIIAGFSNPEYWALKQIIK